MKTVRLSVISTAIIAITVTAAFCCSYAHCQADVPGWNPRDVSGGPGQDRLRYYTFGEAKSEDSFEILVVTARMWSKGRDSVEVAQTHLRPGVRLLFLEAGEGLPELAEKLERIYEAEGRKEASTIGFLSHQPPSGGELRIGTTKIKVQSTEDLEKLSDSVGEYFKRIGKIMTADGQIQWLGCDTAGPGIDQVILRELDKISGREQLGAIKGYHVKDHGKLERAYQWIFESENELTYSTRGNAERKILDGTRRNGYIKDLEVTHPSLNKKVRKEAQERYSTQIVPDAPIRTKKAQDEEHKKNQYDSTAPVVKDPGQKVSTPSEDEVSQRYADITSSKEKTEVQKQLCPELLKALEKDVELAKTSHEGVVNANRQGNLSWCRTALSELEDAKTRIKDYFDRYSNECADYSDPKIDDQYRENMLMAINQALALEGRCEASQLPSCAQIAQKARRLVANRRVINAGSLGTPQNSQSSEANLHLCYECQDEDGRPGVVILGGHGGKSQFFPAGVSVQSNCNCSTANMVINY